MNDANDKNDAETYHRCYCTIQHEYQKFAWFDEGEMPHIIEMCDGFIDCAEEEETTETNQRRQQKEKQLVPEEMASHKMKKV